MEVLKVVWTCSLTIMNGLPFSSCTKAAFDRSMLAILACLCVYRLSAAVWKSEAEGYQTLTSLWRGGIVSKLAMIDDWCLVGVWIKCCRGPSFLSISKACLSLLDQRKKAPSPSLPLLGSNKILLCAWLARSLCLWFTWLHWTRN